MNIGTVIKKYRKEIGITQEEMANIIEQIDDMFAKEGFENTFEWVSKVIKKYPNCNKLIWQAAVILDARRMTGECQNPESYDEQINSWYKRVLNDTNEEIQYRAADSLFGFCLRKKEYSKAEKYLTYFSERDPMRKIYQGRLFMEQGKIEEAYEVLESVVFLEYSTLNYALSFIVNLALEEDDEIHARLVADKIGNMACAFDMGKYHEYSSMLDVVCAKKDVDGTYNVVKHLLDSVDTICDFQKSQLYRHKHFAKVDSSYYEKIRENLLAGFRDEEEFEYMKDYEPWENIMNNNS